MVRYRSQSSAQISPQLSLPIPEFEPANVAAVSGSVVGPRLLGRFVGDPREWVPAGEEERFERLCQRTTTVGRPELREPAAWIGAALQCQIPGRSDQTDRSAVGHVLRLIAGYLEPALPIDVSEVFRRSVVDGYINHLAATGRGDGARQTRVVLYALGRLVHPREYPISRAADSLPQKRAKKPATDAIIADWYSTAASLPGEPGRRAYVSLDLALGAGIRQGELLRVRGTSVAATKYQGREYAVVTLPNRAGGVRHVPVADVDRSRRILQRAAEVGDGSMLVPGCGNPERNMGNRLNEMLKMRGQRPIDILAARERWIFDLALTVPACLLVQLSDINDFDAMRHYRKQFPTYGIRATMVALEPEGRAS